MERILIEHMTIKPVFVMYLRSWIRKEVKKLPLWLTSDALFNINAVSQPN
jgi:hypothetical protein